MEMICIGFLGGVIFSVILIAGGVCINDKGNNKGKLDGDNSSDDNISSGDGDRSWDYRYYKSFNSEQKVVVLTSLLHDYDHSLSPHEKDILRSLILEFDE